GHVRAAVSAQVHRHEPAPRSQVVIGELTSPQVSALCPTVHEHDRGSSGFAGDPEPDSDTVTTTDARTQHGVILAELRCGHRVAVPSTEAAPAVARPHPVRQPSTTIPTNATTPASSVDVSPSARDRPPVRISPARCTDVPSPNNAPASNSVLSVAAPSNTARGRIPVLRTATIAMNPSTNSGTSGGRLPAPTAPDSAPENRRTTL